MVSVRLGFRKRRLTVKDISHSNLHVGLDTKIFNSEQPCLTCIQPTVIVFNKCSCLFFCPKPPAHHNIILLKDARIDRIDAIRPNHITRMFSKSVGLSHRVAPEANPEKACIHA